MLEGLKKSITDPSNLTDEQLMNAYEIINKYCKENDTDVLTLVNDDKNIPPASIKIHESLPWLVRKVFSSDEIENLITTNIDFIREKATFFHKQEKKSKKVKVSKK